MRLILLLIFIISCDSDKHPMGNKTVQISVDDFLQCGAVEYMPGVLLTSAHCIPEGASNSIKINQKSKQAKQIIVHPNWDADTVRFDLAIVMMDSPTGSSIAIDSVQGGDRIETVTKEKVKFHEVKFNDQERFAAKDIKDKICKGDSGSPTYAKIGEKYYLVGIVSGITKVKNDCNNGGSSIFADVSALSDWIEAEISTVY